MSRVFPSEVRLGGLGVAHLEGVKSTPAGDLVAKYIVEPVNQTDFTARLGQVLPAMRRRYSPSPCGCWVCVSADKEKRVLWVGGRAALLERIAYWRREFMPEVVQVVEPREIAALFFGLLDAAGV